LAIEKHVISFVNCGRDLARERMEDKDLGPPLLVANPDFSRGRPAAAAKQDDHKGLRLLGGHPKGPLPELPEVGAIVGELETSLKRYSKQSPRTHQRDQARASKLRDVKRPHILVVGTHGFYLSGKAEAEQEPRRAVANRPCVDGVKAMEASDSPRGNNPLFRCGLYLAGADSFLAGNAAVDAVLTGAELAATDLHGTELVVLLACQTGVGAVRAGDSVASLRQAFQLAGAESVVATLWEVPEKESAQLTEEFFNNLANGQSKPEALRNAQLSIIRGGKEHPWYWAAWTITGPPTPLSPPAQGWTLLA
jgi:hypothetical protein